MRTKYIVQIAVIAAIYTVLTAIFMTVSFTALQLRVSEIMVFLAYFNPLAIVGLTIGCFLTNLLMSPMPLWDCVFGTMATLLSVIAIHLTSKTCKGSVKGMIIASIWPVLFNSVIIGSMLCVLGLVPFGEKSYMATLVATIGSVGLGEFIVTVVMGIPVTYMLMTKYKRILNQYLMGK